MDKLEQSRQWIERVINYYSQFKPAVGDVERVVSFDRQRDRYHLFTIGWNKHQHIYGCLKAHEQNGNLKFGVSCKYEFSQRGI